MMVTLLFVALAAVTIEAASVFNTQMAEWKTYKMQYGKIYKNEKEEEFRMHVYLNSSLVVKEHEKLYAEGKVTFRIGINKFSDLLQEEFEEMMHMNDDENDNYNTELCELHHFATSTGLSDEWDWRNMGAVGRVKNQEHYGGCWAFSAVGTLEGHHFLKTKELVLLSEQNLIDCIKRKGQGGNANQGLVYVMHNGIESEESYPYIAEENDECLLDESRVAEKIKGCRRVARNDEKQLKIAVEKVGPIAVSFYSRTNKFRHYTGGIIYDEECFDAEKTTHAVVLVGFGTENGTDYWILKNSWGENWGEHGYFRMARNKDSHCLIAYKPHYPID